MIELTHKTPDDGAGLCLHRPPAGISRSVPRARIRNPVGRIVGWVSVRRWGDSGLLPVPGKAPARCSGRCRLRAALPRRSATAPIPSPARSATTAAPHCCPAGTPILAAADGTVFMGKRPLFTLRIMDGYRYFRLFQSCLYIILYMGAVANTSQTTMMGGILYTHLY